MRSPLLGYNHNVKYGGQIFHVQTEDSGPGNPHIFTHLFFAGSILASKREEYEPKTPEDEVRALMQSQHKAILKELKHADYDQRIASFFASRGETFPAEEPAVDSDLPPATAASRQPPPAAAEPSAPEADVLDLDSIPAPLEERATTPEPLPGRLTRPVASGPGSYTLRRPTSERITAPLPPPKPRSTARPVPARPITPVVVQRQIVVGGTAPAVSATRKPVTTPVRRRAVSGGPYVVKEGSHVTAAIPPGARRSEPPPRPMAPVPEPEQAPRTADAGPDSSSGRVVPAPLLSEQSLDDVILAYLSQGDGKG